MGYPDNSRPTPDPFLASRADIDHAVGLVRADLAAARMDETTARRRVAALLEGYDAPARVARSRARCDHLGGQTVADLYQNLSRRLQDRILAAKPGLNSNFDLTRPGSATRWAHQVADRMSGEVLRDLYQRNRRTRPDQGLVPTPAGRPATGTSLADRNTPVGAGTVPTGGDTEAGHEAMRQLIDTLRGKRRAELPFVQSETLYRGLGIDTRLPRPLLPAPRERIAARLAADPAAALQGAVQVLEVADRDHAPGVPESAGRLDLLIASLWVPVGVAGLRRLTTLGRHTQREQVAHKLVAAAVADRPAPARARVDRLARQINGHDPTGHLVASFIAAECEPVSDYHTTNATGTDSGSGDSGDSGGGGDTSRWQQYRHLYPHVLAETAAARNGLGTTGGQVAARLRALADQMHVFPEDHIFPENHPDSPNGDDGDSSGLGHQ